MDLQLCIKKIKNICEKGLSENICIDCPIATTPPKQYFILGHTFQDRKQIECGKCIAKQILKIIKNRRIKHEKN